MSIFVSFELENDKDFFKAVQKALSLVDDLRGPFGDIVRDFFKSNTAVFGNGKSSLYGTNTPYSEKYEISKSRDSFSLARPYPFLVRTGRLRDSLTGTPNQDSVVSIGKRSLVVGTDVPYGVYHQSDKERRVIPLRKFLFIGPEARRYVSAETGRARRYLGIIDVWVTRKVAKAFNK